MKCLIVRTGALLLTLPTVASASASGTNPKTVPRPYSQAHFQQGLQSGSLQALPGQLALGGGDDCAAPDLITGTGSFFFSTMGATPGLPQGLPCGAGVAWDDVWFDWTCPTTGTATWSHCNPAFDSIVAVYSGSGCPAPGTALACNDDAPGCGVGSAVQFPCVAGSHYMFQIGGQAPGCFTAWGCSGNGYFMLSVSNTPVNDDCTSPTQISGTGTFPFDNLMATTGQAGQHEALCAQSGSPAIQRDVWYVWTAPSSGTAVINTDWLTTVQTRLAAYAGSGCPSQGTALACSLPVCNGPIAFQVTAGSTYTLQLGSTPGTPGGAGSFSVDVVLPNTNDDCSNPLVLPPTGPYPFTLVGSSTGTQGQSEALCSLAGVIGIDNDVWFTWTAPSSGEAVLSTCGCNFDTKVAVYAGAGCPAPGSAIACDDYSCGYQALLCFNALAGSTYTIQVGTGWVGDGPCRTGYFDLHMSTPLQACSWDDGSVDDLLTWNQGGDMVWLNRFGSAGATTFVAAIDVIWGSASRPGMNPASSGRLSSDVFVWQDGPSQDGDPSDATLLLQIPVTITDWDHDRYVSIPIPPLSIQGVFFVGCHQDCYGLSGLGPEEWVVPIDYGCSSGGVAWYFGNYSGYGSSPVDYAHPANNLFPPHNLAPQARVCVRAGCNAGPGIYLCDPGFGSTLSCPCANPPSGSLRGCDNSSATGGASIATAGSNSIAAPTLVLSTAGERPVATSVVLQGTLGNSAGLAFGQGVRCAAGVLTRLYTTVASGGGISAPNFAAGDLDIPTRSAMLGDPITAGQSRWYVVYYRDPFVLGGCSGLATFNCTNTVEIPWLP